MNRFGVRLLGFLSLQLLFFVAVFDLGPATGDRSYIAVWGLKYERLASLEGPRLIAAGDSNVAFGIRTQDLECALGMPAVNMAVHAGLGMRLLLEPLLPHLRAGDVVVVSLTKELFWSESPGGELVMHLVSNNPQAALQLGAADWKNMGDMGHVYIGERLRSRMPRWLGLAQASEQRAVSLSGLNAWGDVVVHRSMDAPPLALQPPEVMQQSVGVGGSVDVEGSVGVEGPVDIEKNVSFLESFVRRAQERGARVAWAFPPAPEEYKEPWQSIVDRISERLEAIDGLVLLDSPEDNWQPRENFWDTEYHLRYEPGRQRTERLAEALRESGVVGR